VCGVCFCFFVGVCVVCVCVVCVCVVCVCGVCVCVYSVIARMNDKIMV